MTEQEFALRAQDQRGRLYRTAFLYLGGEHAAVDAVDEAVYRAFRDRRKLRQPEFFETWLTRILINVCKDELRRRRRLGEKATAAASSRRTGTLAQEMAKAGEAFTITTKAAHTPASPASSSAGRRRLRLARSIPRRTALSSSGGSRRSCSVSTQYSSLRFMTPPPVRLSGPA